MRLPLARLATAMAVAAPIAAIVYGAAPTRRAGPRTPVLVELFTSEGCSSCPPADTLLARLVTDQPIDGVEVVGLSLHVDYWNRLGWVDPFSKAAFTDRQNDYATIWGVSRVYTPQAVVDGAHEFVGSDSSSAREHIRAAGAAPKVPIAIDVEPQSRGSDEVSVRISGSPSSPRASTVDVMLAVAEDGLVSEVRRGENAGHALSHVAVVRSLKRVVQWDLGKRLDTTSPLRLDPAWHRDRIRLVVFIQDPVSRGVLGIATNRLAAS